MINSEDKYSDDNVEINIMPIHIYQSVKEAKIRNESNYILFESVVDGVFSGIVKLNFHVNVKYFALEDFLFEKFSQKIKQHSKSPISKKIFVFEFENINIYNKFRTSFPINKNIFNSQKFTRLLDDDKAIVFVLKTVDNNQYKIDWGVFCNERFNPHLKNLLLKLKLNWQ